jgi:uncharacterized protein (TIGR01319 family)
VSGPDADRREQAAGRHVLLVDCGSTRTKVVLVAGRGSHAGIVAAADARTTVEGAGADVMTGLAAALRELEARAGRRLLDADGRLVRPAGPEAGVDALYAASSAGGGLRMLVMGAVREITAAAAAEAALGAGAVVGGVIAVNDEATALAQMARIAAEEADLILMAAGTDGGSRKHAATLAQWLAGADPVPRPGREGRVPVVFAGNRDAAPEVRAILGADWPLAVADNLQPNLEETRPGPARDAIHAAFLDHVIRHAPGYAALAAACDRPVQPTPAALTRAVARLARRRGDLVLAVDLGGATTDVVSASQARCHRSVSANLGVSYSVGRLWEEATPGAVLRWLTSPLSEDEAWTLLCNKLVRPFTIPELPGELELEQALVREALRLALAQHRRVLPRGDPLPTKGDLAAALGGRRPSPVPDEVGRPDAIVASGGVLTRTPRPWQAVAMLVDGLQPHGRVELFLDRAQALPLVGLLDEAEPGLADALLDGGILSRLGTVVAPLTLSGAAPDGLGRIRVRGDGATGPELLLARGDLIRLGVPPDGTLRLEIAASAGVDWGAGPGRDLVLEVRGGEFGVLLDGRPRPLAPEAGGAGQSGGILARAWRDAIAGERGEGIR